MIKYKRRTINQKAELHDKEFVIDLLKESHVLVVHGSGFCQTFGKDHFRAVILPPMETLEQAFNKLEQFMKKHTKP